ncbi:response regulator transcription factor [Limnohabitans sp.]|uniref:response regulator n=1 Tax=Limnohabitans sp. TaxID=1907725 RepID=UPI0025C43A8D|nr:response regulator transcription factor [Limnohabitans sp.]
MKTLLIVEDDRALREHLLFDAGSGTPGWQVLAADSLGAARQCLRAQRPDAMFVDLGLPDGDGIELIQQCHTAWPSCDILVITVFADEQRVIRSLEAGACGYILKPDLPIYAGRLVATIDAGGSPLSPSIARGLIDRLHTPKSKPTLATDSEALSAREQEVLSLCARGFRYAEIAQLLGLSTHTVNAHLKNVYRKLAVNSKVEAVFEARRSGLIDS